LSVSGINFLENVPRCGNVVSLFPSVVPLSIHTADCPIRSVVTRVFRKRGSSTREGLRPFLIIASLQHSSNSARLLRQYSLSLAQTLALCISIVFSTQIHILVCMSSNRRQVAFFPLLQARSSCHIAS
jgi:hypothetical protein